MTDVGRERFHFIGICGRAMGAIALALAKSGHVVTGSDEGTYGSVRDELRQAGIAVAPRYAETNLPAAAQVVVGKRLTADNPEWQAAIRRGLSCVSFPVLLRDRFLSHSRNAVVAGGVGKTTTTAMLAWILEHAGFAPDYLIGGTPGNFRDAARFSGAGITVMEGDEYASRADDPTPKFLHYAPEVVLVTNILEDHPDLYADFAHLEAVFHSLVRLVPAGGCAIVSGDDAGAARLATAPACRFISVGFCANADLPITDLQLTSSGSGFYLGGVAFHVPVFGRMNVRNAAMAAAGAAHFGVSHQSSAAALAAFTGVNDRQQGRDAGGCTVVTDKASHPHSLAELAGALRQRYPGRRLIAVVEPRATGGRRWIYQRDLPAALAGFDRVVLTRAYEHRPPPHTPWEHEPFSMDQLAGDLRSLAAAVTIAPTLEDLPAVVSNVAVNGDVVLMALREQHVAHVDAVAAHIFESQRRSRPR